MQKAQPLVHPRDLPPPKLNGSFQDHLCKSCWPHSPPRTLPSSHPGARHPGWGFISQFHIPSQASSSRCPNFPSCLCYSPPSCSCSLLYSCTLDSHAWASMQTATAVYPYLSLEDSGQQRDILWASGKESHTSYPVSQEAHSSLKSHLCLCTHRHDHTYHTVVHITVIYMYAYRYKTSVSILIHLYLPTYRHVSNTTIFIYTCIHACT